MANPLLLLLPRQKRFITSHAHDVRSTRKVLSRDSDPSVGSRALDGLDQPDVLLPSPAAVPIDARVDVTRESLATLPRFPARNHLRHARPHAQLRKSRQCERA